MLNKIDLMGRLVADPELRRTQEGKAVCSFALAVQRDRQRDQTEKEVDYIDIVTWEKTAEYVSKWFVKGKMAIVTGRLQIRKWTDKEGVRRFTPEVIADSVYFADDIRKREQQEIAADPAPVQTQQMDRPQSLRKKNADEFAEIFEKDDALPF